jgi:ribonuclease R
MLPEKLSNEICSLQPGKPRYTMSVVAELTPKAEVVNYEIVESIIINKRRYNYQEVQDIIDNKTGDYKEQILDLFQLSLVLREKRYKLGGINFNTVEYKFKLDENKFPIEVIAKTSTPATQLVEEFMLLANKIVAEHILVLSKQHQTKEVLPFIYRVHDLPDPDKLKEVLLLIKSIIGANVSTRNVSSSQLNQYLDDVKGKIGEHTVNQLLIRSMAKAEYSEKNIGHYGLGFKDYTHFTSPIRRYPDLLVHRLLKEYSTTKLTNARLKLLKLLVKDTAKNSTIREIKAMEAERASNKVALLFITQDKVGDVFNGIVTGVTTWGIYVKLDELHSEGLVKIRDLMDDYYFFDEKTYRLIGKRTKKIFEFGSKIQVRVSKVDFEKRQIELIYGG